MDLVNYQKTKKWLVCGLLLLLTTCSSAKHRVKGPITDINSNFVVDANGVVTSDGLIIGSIVMDSNSVVFQPLVDSTTMFQVLDADGGTPVFNVDTTNERVGIGTATPNNTFQVANLINFDDTLSNVFLGTDSGGSVTTGSFNVAIGKLSLRDLTDGSLNFALGASTLVLLDGGDGNVAIGGGAGADLLDGNRNIFIGTGAGNQIEGSSTIALGYHAGFGLGSGFSNWNIFIGEESGRDINGGDRNVFLGYRSGSNQTTLSDLLIIDNQDRGSAAAEITDALIYGQFGTAGTQTIRFNTISATFGNNTHEDTDGGGDVKLTGRRQDGAGTETESAQIEFAHDGSGANDQLGKITESVNTGSGLVAVREVDSSGNTKIGDAGTTDYVEISATGDQVFNGSGGLPFAQIYEEDGTSTLALAAQDTFYQVTAFSVDGESNNATPDHTNDHITIVKAGMYLVSLNMSFSQTTAVSIEYDFHVQKNNGATDMPQVSAHRNSGGASSVGNCGSTGIIDLAASDTVELWVERLDGAAVSRTITIQQCGITLTQIGGT